MNSVNLTGRLTDTPTLKKTDQNESVCAFTIAINRGKDKQAYFIRCNTWRTTAENLVKFGYKGMLIAIEGEITSSKYEDKNGVTQYRQDVRANKIEYLSRKDEAQPQEEVEDLPF